MTLTRSDRLLKKFGELMTYEQLAKELKRSSSGLRITVSRQASDFAISLNRARVKLGRRVYFKTTDIAELVDRS